jgi:hypothetical protein
LNAENSDKQWTLQVFSPHATAASTRTGLPNGVEFVRVVGDDDQLVKALHHELHLRNACPNEHFDNARRTDNSTNATADQGRQADSHIALITEQDTRYGREIVDAFKEQFGAGNVLTFRYLRGIDGRTWRPSGSQPEPEAAPAVSDRGLNDPYVALPDNGEWKWRPDGTSQYDYLLRLREILQNKDRELTLSGERGIRAIGVVATDVYDKLLVLRALRSSFPRAVFFTTDLDANLSHVDEYPSTRNLIVASHFGLRLHPDLQQDIPPFRESYQTSTFLATLLALNFKGAELRLNPADPWGLNTIIGEGGSHDSRHGAAANAGAGAFQLRPVVFEIGRCGPFQLTLSRETTLLPDQFQRFDTNRDQALNEPEFDTLLGECELKQRGLIFADVDQDQQLSYEECLNNPELRSLGLINPLSQRESPFPWLVFWGAALLVACLATFAINGILDMDKMLTGVRSAVDRFDVVFRSLEQRVIRRNSERAVVNLEAAAIAVRTWLLSPAMLPFWSTLVAAGAIQLLAGFAGLFPDWEPLNLAYAVSIWPTLMIEAALVCLCCGLLASWWSRGSAAPRRPVAQDGLWNSELPLEFQPTDFSGISLRSRIGVLLGILLVMLLFRSWMFSVSPARGVLSRFLDVAFIFLTNLSVVLVVVSVVTYLERCRQLVRRAAEQACHDQHYLRAVRIIASQTDATKWRVPLGITVLIGLAMSYHPRLDFRPLPYGTLVGGCLACGALLLWGFLLRRDAQRVRAAGIDALHVRKLKLLGHEADVGPDADDGGNGALGDRPATDAGLESRGGAGVITITEMERAIAARPRPSVDDELRLIDEEIRYIESINTGAYRALLSGPTMAWLTGSAGAWFGIDWLLNALQTGI